MKKVLIIQQKMIGDVLTSSILFESLKKEHPNYKLHYLINEHTLSVVENNPFIDEFVILKPEDEENIFRFLKFVKYIRGKKYDVIIDVYNKLGSNLITLFSGAKYKAAYYKSYTNFFYDFNFKRHKIATNRSSLAIEHRLNLLKNIIKNIDYSLTPKIYLTKDEYEYGKNELKHLEKPLFMISALGSSSNKTYPLNYMAKLLDSLVNLTNGNLLFNYIPNQIEDIKTLYNFCKPKTQQHIHLNIYGKNLRQFLALTSQCNAVIGNEGGAINMAKALQVPTFSIFSPWITREDWGVSEALVIHKSVHISDFKPKITTLQSKKHLKTDGNKTAYMQFKPDYILPILKSYITSLKKL